MKQCAFCSVKEQHFHAEGGLVVTLSGMKKLEAERDALHAQLAERDSFIHDLEANCDPAGTVCENTLLRDQTKQLDAMIGRLKGELAERDALLRDLEELGIVEGGWTELDEILLRVKSALSASAEPSAPTYPQVRIVRAHKHTCANVQPGSTSADVCDCGAVVNGEPVPVEPSAPVERDERAEFEHAVEGIWGFSSNQLCLLTGPDLWKVWQARAALERKP